MRKLKTLFTVLFLAVLGLGNVWAEEVVYKTALFGSSYNSQGVSAYNASWTATNNGFTVNLVNWNNNNNGWAYIKAGNKNTAYVGTITTVAAIDKKVTKVVVTIDAITAANVNSIKLYTGASANACTTEIGSFDKSTGEKTVTLTSPTANIFYKISFDCIAKANGCVQVSKVEYYYDDAEDAPSGCSTPTITFAEESVAKLTTDAAFTNAASVEYESTATGQTITYSVETGKDGVATVNASTGEVTIVGAGEAKIYASVAADATYCEKSAYYTLTVTAPEEGVSFEKELTAYTDWDFNNFETKQTNANVAAHSGMYFGTTGGKAGCTMTTKNKVNPASISFYVSKTTTNTTTSNWIVQVSTTGNSWTDVKTASATSMDRGTWVEVSQDLSTYTDVYVRVKYDGSTAVRTIDDVILTTRELAHSTVSFAQPEHGTVSASATENVEEGTQVTLTYTPADGYKLTAFDAYKTGDEATKVTVTDGKFTMPAFDVTATATIEVAKAFNGSDLTLSGEYPTEFWKGDAFSHEGMTVSALFNTGAEDVTSSAVFSGYDMANAGTQTVTVTFTEGGASQTATYEITVKSIGNTQATAYTATEAKALVDANNDLSTLVYVKGIVSEIVTEWSESYGNITFNISADGATTGDQFQLYRNFKGADKAKWTSTDMIPEVGDEVVAYGEMTNYKGTYELKEGNYLVYQNRPVVLTSIELNTDEVKKTYKIGTDDVFSAEGLVVTAHYNVSSNDKTIDLSDVTISGYNMEVANTYDVTVSYTENEVTKTATYQIQVKPNCETLATITMGAAENGTFDLTVKGEQCAETAISTVLTAVPATHYHLASVTATNGTVGAIEGNTCTISDITADAEITAVFEEDAKGTATFVAGAAEATGTAPASITKYVGETLTIPANTFALAGGYKFAGWKYNETIYQKGDEFTVAGDAEFVAQWEALPVWATTYTSNVTVGTDAVMIAGTSYDAKKTGTSSAAGKTTVTVPAGATALHFHAAAWNDEVVTLKVSNGATELGSFALLKDGGMRSNSPFTLQNDPAQEYYMVALEGIVAETTITFEANTSATAGKRFAIYGVNYVAPASVELAPASHDFEEVKEGETADFEFTATKNIFATGDIVVTFEGADATAFSAGAVDAETGKFTVTFAPTDVRAYSATVKVTVDDAEATATLAGEGISATTPTISTDVETIDFGSVKQDASVAAQTVTVTLEYLDAATVEISGSVFSIDKTALSESGAITISANTAAMGTYTEALTISGEGATSQTVTVTMEVISKYASEYTSNVTVGGDKVVIDEVEYEAIKKGTSSKSETATITVPKGTQTLHFHAAAWNNENTILVVKQGATTLGSFNLYKDGGVKGTGPSYTLEGDNYDTDQYFNVSVAAYTAEAEAEITFTTTASPYRFVLYGVNQEGGIVPVLDHIAIEGTATALTYEVGDEFDPAGLSVKAYYTMEGVIDDSKTKTLDAADFEWSFSPATLAAETESVEATATYEGLNATKTITGLTVTVPAPEIEVSATKLAFGTVEVGEAVEAKAVTVTLKNLAAAIVTISGEGAAKFAADVTSLTESGDVTISVVTDEAGEYTATLTISGEGAEDKTVALSMTVVTPDDCEGTDDFETATSESASSYNSRTTTDGWSAINAALTTMGDEKFLTINGKTSEVGVITSPVIANGLKDLKIRYANTFSEENGAKFRVDVKVADKVVYTETVTRANADMTQNEIYTAEFTDMKVLGDCQIVITNLSPSNNSSKNKDRLSIGRICYNSYADDEVVTRELTGMGTHCYPFTIETGAYTGATFYQIAYKKSEVSIVWDEVLGDIEAGNPYLVVLNEGATELKYLPGATEAVEAKAVNGFVGFYNGEEKYKMLEPNAGNYIVYNNEFRLAGDNVAVGANRAYIHLEDVNPTETQAPAGARRFVMHNTEGTEITTGINGANGNLQTSKMLINGRIYILRGENIYDVNGTIVK